MLCSSFVCLLFVQARFVFVELLDTGRPTNVCQISKLF